MRIPRIKEKYQKETVPALMKRFGYKNVMQVPGLKKIVINVGVGEAIQNMKLLDAKAGMPIGCTVTLRKRRMYEFFDRLVNVAIPRIRDFRGTSPNSFDGRGNYNLGISEQIIFPEIDYDKVEKIMGMNVTIATTARTDEEGFELLKNLGVPFRG
jgi:large subunit ribosomal protein L5